MLEEEEAEAAAWPPPMEIEESASSLALTAKRWSRRCTRRSTENSRSPFSSLSWCRELRSDATARKARACITISYVVRNSTNYKAVLLTVKVAGLLHEELAPLFPLSLEQLVQSLWLVLAARGRRSRQEVAP